MIPAEDRTRSPYTGWTREHWTAVADRLLAGLEPYRSPEGARIDLPGPASAAGPDSDALEGFARTFLLAGFRIAGERGADPTHLLERYARGLAAGTDPRSPEAWPRPDQLNQAKVEAASIALILQLTRPWLWDRLDSPVRRRTAEWLGAVVGQPYPENNWIWFRIVVESFLRENGGTWSPADLRHDLATHARLRRTGGWLSDGPQRAYDHYVGWALQLFPLLWTHLFDVDGTLCPPGLRQCWADDLAGYLDDAVRLVGADGAPLIQGRSLTYRFATAAPFWVGAVTGTGGLTPGLTRRTASGMLRHFVEHGALGDDDVLRLGYFGAWPRIRQPYSGPASPYWSAKGMLGLMLPADHPVWTDTERPLPVQTGDVARVVEAPGWLVHASRADGVGIVLNHGTDHAQPGDTVADSPLYARLGYSTATSPLLDDAGPLDNAVVVLDRDGRASHRSGFTSLYQRSGPHGVLSGASAGPVHWIGDGTDGGSDASTAGPWLTVVSVLRDGTEVRLARLDGTVEPGGTLRVGGWPLAAEQPPRADTGSTVGAPAAATRTATLCSTVHGLAGYTRAGVAHATDASPLGRYAATPWLSAAAEPGRVYAATVHLGRSEPAPPPRLEVHADPAGAHRVRLDWPDGVHTTADLPPPGDGALR